MPFVKMETTIELHRDELRALMLYLEVSRQDLHMEEIVGHDSEMIRDFSNAIRKLDEADDSFDRP